MKMVMYMCRLIILYMINHGLASLYNTVLPSIIVVYPFKLDDA